MSPYVKKLLRPLAVRVLGTHYPAVMRRIHPPRIDFQRLERRDVSLAVPDEPHLAAMIDAPGALHFSELRPCRANGVRRQNSGSETLLYADGDEAGFIVDRTCDWIWTQCNGRRTVAEIGRRLRDRTVGLPTSEAAAILRDALLRLYQLELVDFPGGSPFGSSETRRIDLRRVTFYVINCAEHETRRDFMESQLRERGLRYEIFPGEIKSPSPVGIALSHLGVLQQTDLEVPFCILEDDCQFLDNFRYELEVPREADAVYFGVSKFGLEKLGQFSWGKANNTKFVRYTDDYLRVLNMLSRHAILYLTERFRESAIDASIAALTARNYPYPADIGYAMLQADHVVLTPRDPVCYQSEKHKGNYHATRHPLRNLIR